MLQYGKEEQCGDRCHSKDARSGVESQDFKVNFAKIPIFPRIGTFSAFLTKRSIIKNNNNNKK